MLIVAPMQLTIAWQEPIENGAYIDAYKVRRSHCVGQSVLLFEYVTVLLLLGM